jgi:hypothetical protein
MRRTMLELMALFFPMAFLRFVNRDRCFIQVTNDADGIWHAKIGLFNERQGTSVSRALYRAVKAVHREPDFQWAREFLKSFTCPKH